MKGSNKSILLHQPYLKTAIRCKSQSITAPTEVFAHRRNEPDLTFKAFDLPCLAKVNEIMVQELILATIKRYLFAQTTIHNRLVKENLQYRVECGNSEHGVIKLMYMDDI